MTLPNTTYHIHIQGIVQGVGFRPFVYKLAKEMNLKGWVMNTNDGVHITFNANRDWAETFFHRIKEEKPEISFITDSRLSEKPYEAFNAFNIIQSNDLGIKNLLISPDFGLCKDCKREIYNQKSRRFQYSFTSCTNCGPRYSIIRKLPYDRNKTTMNDIRLCPSCQEEFHNPADRRYYHQTNSCQLCPVLMRVFEQKQEIQITNQNQILDYIVEKWEEGKIVGIKGTGGFLITCDAANHDTIARLRHRKNRPTKPFALMYHDKYILAEDTEMDISAAEELESLASPIVLFSLKDDRMTDLATEIIAPHLFQIGVMQPYTPLFELLMRKYQKPIIATSGNKSGSTIIYKDEQAIDNLSELCDSVVIHNREIVVPQDDSVVKYSPVKRNRIIIRRSRGFAPSYVQKIKNDLPDITILCMGASLKSTFTLLHNRNIFVSQYLGDTEDYEAQKNFMVTLKNLLNIMDAKPEFIVTDTHPNYFSTQYGQELASKYNIKNISIQHHEAHFWAVLAENDLLQETSVAGVVWDGTGLGRDGHIWGGEIFIYTDGSMDRIDHLDYFNFILGDKMAKEPRISALSILGQNEFLKDKFTTEEWKIYGNLLCDNQLKSSSAGRLFDAAAQLILGIDIQSYEGEAAMRLENSAYKYFRKYGITTFYSYLKEGFIPDNFPLYVLSQIIGEVNKGYDPEFMAAKFHITLAHYINNKIRMTNVKKITFSGGVFQNGWLVDLLHLFLEPDYELYFHKHISPNDESISFGQLHGFLSNIIHH